MVAPFLFISRRSSNKPWWNHFSITQNTKGKELDSLVLLYMLKQVECPTHHNRSFEPFIVFNGRWIYTSSSEHPAIEFSAYVSIIVKRPSAISVTVELGIPLTKTISCFWPARFLLLCSLFNLFADSHPLFRRGYEVLCKDIKRPSTKNQNELSAMKQGGRQEANAPQALLSNIVPIEPTSNTASSFRRVITDENLAAKASINASQHLAIVSAQERSIERLDKPFQMIITSTTSTSSSPLEPDPLVMRSSEFNWRASFQRNSSPFAFEEDDVTSIGTIDDFHNIHNIVGWGTHTRLFRERRAETKKQNLTDYTSFLRNTFTRR